MAFALRSSSAVNVVAKATKSGTRGTVSKVRSFAVATVCTIWQLYDQSTCTTLRGY